MIWESHKTKLMRLCLLCSQLFFLGCVAGELLSNVRLEQSKGTSRGLCSDASLADNAAVVSIPFTAAINVQSALQRLQDVERRGQGTSSSCVHILVSAECLLKFNVSCMRVMQGYCLVGWHISWHWSGWDQTFCQVQAPGSVSWRCSYSVNCEIPSQDRIPICVCYPPHLDHGPKPSAVVAQMPLTYYSSGVLRSQPLGLHFPLGPCILEWQTSMPACSSSTYSVLPQLVVSFIAMLLFAGTACRSYASCRACRC